jgi:hypothetical protein
LLQTALKTADNEAIVSAVLRQRTAPLSVQRPAPEQLTAAHWLTRFRARSALITYTRHARTVDSIVQLVPPHCVAEIAAHLKNDVPAAIAALPADERARLERAQLALELECAADERMLPTRNGAATVMTTAIADDTALITLMRDTAAVLSSGSVLDSVHRNAALQRLYDALRSELHY